MREEFEKAKHRLIRNRQKRWTPEDRIEIATFMEIAFMGFKAGRDSTKSRDEEIKKLELHDKITKDYTTELIVKNGRCNAEIKKLRDALEWVADEVQRQREGEGGDLRTIKYHVEKALKESK